MNYYIRYNYIMSIDRDLYNDDISLIITIKYCS